MSTTPDPTSFEPPSELKQLGGYRVQKLLGRGGMGEVYLAENEMMGRQEVLKVVNKTYLARPGAFARFAQEIRNAAQLDHPNIVTAYSVHTPSDSLVLAMQYVPGVDLEKVVKEKGPPAIANAVLYAIQTARGLQHAMDKKMVHRDIKPSNLILQIDQSVQPPRHLVKILDFGLAKATSEKPVEGSLTGDGQMLGTPHYMSPEQTLDAAKADIRSDIYALGCTLYYLLTGRPPFHAPSLLELLQAHHNRTADPVHRIRPEVPESLSAVVAKMMAKRPDDRFQTPNEVVQALTQILKSGTGKSPSGKGDDDVLVLPTVPVLPAVPSAKRSTALDVEPGRSTVTGSPPDSIGKSSGTRARPDPSGGAGGRANPSADSGSGRAKQWWDDAAEPDEPDIPGRNRTGGRDRRSGDGGSGGGGKIVAITLVAFLMIAGGTVAVLFATGAFSSKKDTDTVTSLPKSTTKPTSAKDTGETNKLNPVDTRPKDTRTKDTRTKDTRPLDTRKDNSGKPDPGKDPPEKKDPPTVDPPPKKMLDPAPWVKLLDDRRAGGFDGERIGKWSVDQGVLTGEADGTAVKLAVLHSTKEYGAFHLRFEMKTSDEGLRRFIAHATGTPESTKGHVLIVGGGRQPLGSYAWLKGGSVGGSLPWQKSGHAATGRPNVWMPVEIVAVRGKLEVRVDGMSVARWEIPNDPVPVGKIALTAPPGGTTQFRNIEIREPHAEEVATILAKGVHSSTARLDLESKWNTRFLADWPLNAGTPQIDDDDCLVLSGDVSLLSQATDHKTGTLEVELSASADSEAWLVHRYRIQSGKAVGAVTKIEGTADGIKAGSIGRDFSPIDLKGRTIVSPLNEPILLTTVVTSEGVFKSDKKHFLAVTVGKSPPNRVQIDELTAPEGRVGLVVKKGTIRIHRWEWK